MIKTVNKIIVSGWGHTHCSSHKWEVFSFRSVGSFHLLP